MPEREPKIKEYREKKTEDIPKTVKNFFEIKNKIEERWRKKIEKKEEVPEAVQDFFKQLDKIDERWQKKLKGKEGMPEAVHDFFKQLDKIEERWRKKIEKKEEIPEAVREFFEQLPGRPEAVIRERPEVPVETPAPEPRRREGQPLRLRPEIRRERPWAKEFISEVGVTLDSREQDSFKKSIEGQLKYREIERAKEWFQNPSNERIIRDAGEDPENDNEMYMRTVAEELGGLADLAEDPDYDHLSASRYALGEKKVPIDRAQIILHQLKQVQDRMGEELSYAKESNNKPLARSKERELEKLFNLRKGLSEKISGRNLKGEVEHELGKKKFFMREKTREKTIKSKIEEKISGEGGIDTYAGNLETTMRRYDAARQQADKKLVILSAEKEIEKSPEGKRVMDALERAYKEQGEGKTALLKLIETIQTRQERERGPLFDMEGDWEEDKPRISQFFGEQGWTFNPEHMEIAKLKMDAKRKPYEKAFEGDVSLVFWIFDYIFEILSVQKETRRR